MPFDKLVVMDSIFFSWNVAGTSDKEVCVEAGSGLTSLRVTFPEEGTATIHISQDGYPCLSIAILVKNACNANSSESSMVSTTTQQM